MFHYYDCDEVRDSGWGCCYRSFQNLMRFHGVTYSMKKLVEQLGGEHWLEPAELIAVTPNTFKCHTFLWYKNRSATKNMRRTSKSEYKTVNGSVCSITERLLYRYGAIVLDNGTSAYCLRKGENFWELLDPHCFREEGVLRKIEDLSVFLNPHPCWMFFAVERNTVETR